MTTAMRRARVWGIVALPLTLALALVGCVPEPGAQGSPAPTSVTPFPTSSLSPTGSTAPTPSGGVSPTAPPSAAPTTTPAPPDASGAEVTIITADLESDGLEVTGQVIGQNDPTATCRLVVTQGQKSLDQSAEVSVSGSNSFCPLMVIDRDALTSGSWNIVIEYRGAASSGRSAVTTVDVP